jgi:hypothetical protein
VVLAGTCWLSRAVAQEEPAGPSASPLAKALQTKVPLDFQQVPLTDVVEYLRTELKLNVVLDLKAAEKIGFNPAQTPVTLHVTHVPLRSALALLLEPLQLGFDDRGDVLFITSQEKLASRLTTVVYEVSDLVKAAPVQPPQEPNAPEQGPQFEYLPLLKSLRSTIDPESWVDAGGRGVVLPFEGTLVVSQTAAAHERIAFVLAELRRLQKLAPGEDGPADALSQALDQTVSLEFQDAGIPDVAAKLREMISADVLIDQAALAEGGIAEDTRLTGKVTRLPFRVALALLLEPYGLAWSRRHDAILITTSARGASDLYVRLYNVRDLPQELAPRVDEPGAAPSVGAPPQEQPAGAVGGLGGGFGDGLATPQPAAPRGPASLTQMVATLVQSGSWAELGGLADLGYAHGALIVRQTESGHAAIRKLLADFRQFRARLKGQAAAEEDPLAKLLATKVLVQFENVPLIEVLDKLATAHELAVALDLKAFFDAGMAIDAAVSLKLADVRLDEALRRMLDPLELTFVPKDGAIYVTTPDGASRLLVTRFYDIRDLLPPKFPAAMAGGVDDRSLVGVITDTIAPDSWTEVGGYGALVVLPDSLAIDQTPEVHDRISALLAELRKVRGQRRRE